MTQAHFIAQKRTEWQREAPEEWKREQPSFFVRSGLPSLWWDCALEFYCFLVDVQDKMADNRTAFAKRFGKAFDGPIFPLVSPDEYLPITADERDTFEVGTTSGDTFGKVTCCLQIAETCKDLEVADVQVT